MLAPALGLAALLAAAGPAAPSGPAGLLPPAVATIGPAHAPPALAADEQMDFKVEWAGITVGKARIWVGQPSGQLVPVFLQAQTAGLVGFVTVRQMLSSNLDAATGLPRSFLLDALEPGDYRHSDQVRYDREAGTATVRQKGKFDKTYDLEVPPGTLDFVALVFRLRALPLEPGAKHEFPVLSGRKVTVVTTEVLGRERVETKAGDFDAIKVKVPTGFDGKFQEKSPTFLWLSDDARRLVVRISTDFAVGRGVADLVAYRPGKAAAAPAPATP
jgi:hypothetical protein